MFDNLRSPDDETRSFEESMGFEAESEARSKPPPKPAGVGFLGMSAPQRLVIALLLLLSVCVVGTMCLLVTGRISAF